MKKHNLFLKSILLFFCCFLVINTATRVAASETTDNDIEMIILFKDITIDESVKNIITNNGGIVLKEFSEIGGIEVLCNPELIPKIKSEKTVQSLSPIHIINLCNQNEILFNEPDNKSKKISSDLYDVYQWDIKRVTNNGESFNIESENHDVVVGIIDTGVDATHPDLVSNFLGGKNLVPFEFVGDLLEKGDLSDLTDRLGHGTSVAGIIAANGRCKGIAPNIGFKSYRVFNQWGETSSSICSSAIIEATKDGVNVINLSIGGYDLKGKCFGLIQIQELNIS